MVTVATHVTDGFARFNRSAHLYGLKLEVCGRYLVRASPAYRLLPSQVLGLNQQWMGGDITRKPGGGQKILLLKKFLEANKDRKEYIVLFTDRSVCSMLVLDVPHHWSLSPL